MSANTMPKVARFWNGVAAEFDAIYTGAGKSQLQRFLDGFFRRDMYQRFHWVMDKAGDMRGKTVCDIGCGSGRFMVEFARRGAQGLTGIDVAPEMLRLARSLVDREGFAQQCELVPGDILDWKADRTFDVAIAIGLWDYIADPRERLGVIHGLTSGTFLSAWPRFWTWRMPVRKLRLQFFRGCPVYFFRKPRIRRLLEDTGFEVLRIETIGKLFCVEARPARRADRSIV
jgi:SAM-dependent methyltransferase